MANRIIDLTQSAASQLGMIGTGTARVRVESVDVVPSIKNGDMKGTFYVQVGAFSVRANADKLYATRRPGGKAAAAPAEGEPAAPATAKEPVVKAPARSSESELDIMVEE